ncbi:MAG TPA: nucleotide sugar dehydrogenase [Caulobacteraceae bacterium]|jgi:UDP-N-acetyl-D-galactosamine dehydrogenase|nr:nucleotide sugar dehydrogenase [Caulobacteraceae bacterium]
MVDVKDARIGVIGLGYVGLPLAVEFGRLYDTVGYDYNSTRVNELRDGHDRTRETDAETIGRATRLSVSDAPEALARCTVFIVTVPTPVDAARTPDLGPLLDATRTVGRLLKKGDVVVYESTVYPGATEEVCVPVLEAESQLKFNTDFFCGYSPERINPGDRKHQLTTIVKVTSGSTPETADFVDALYASIVPAGTHKTSSIRVAEAAKVIENTQRDVNIALINELAMIFNRLGIDSLEVLEAAGSKWNFLPFRPGLVGGHCIGVDPYYLTYKAQEIGYHAQMILAGRRINDAMGDYVADQVLRLMARRKINAVGARVLLLGFAFKENCPDIRNTRVIDIIQALRQYGVTVDVHDPWICADDAVHEYGVELTDAPGKGVYDAVVLAVAHREFVDLGADALRAYGRPGAVLYDVKSALPRDSVDARL